MAPDKIAHLKAGLAAAAAAAAGAAAMRYFGVSALPIGIAMGSLACAAAVEWSQDNSNRRLAEQGLPPLHDVSGTDFAASAVPGLLIAAAVEVAYRIGVL